MRRVLLALLAVVAVAGALAGCTHGGETAVRHEGNGWPESAEFSQLLTGQTRFSVHDTNLDGWRILVDHRTGVQYIVGNDVRTVCPLLDVDGSPLRVLEASDDGE